jgi:hypothetical protein
MPTLTKYNNFLKTQMNGGAGTAARVVDFDTDTIKIALASASYTPNASTHAVFSDITNEVTGTNYTAGGATITTPTLTESSGTVTFGGDNITWAYSAAGFTNARYAILYKSTGTSSTSTLIGYYDLGSDQSNATVPFSVIFPSSTILNWS